MFRNNPFRREPVQHALKLDDEQNKHEKYLNKLINDDPKETSLDWLDKAKQVARDLIRKEGESNTDEVCRIVPVPEGLNPAVRGFVHRGSEFRKIGVKPRELNKGGGGYVDRWALND